MPKPAAEPTNLVLEQLRMMRMEMGSRFDKMDARFERVEADIADLKRHVRGLKLNTNAEIYKANLTVASFANLERRVQALEQKASS